MGGNGQVEQFKTYELNRGLRFNEKLLIITRKHWFVLVPPLMAILGGGFLFSALIVLLNIYVPFLQNSSLPFTSILLLLAFISSLIIKMVVDWYFHIYIVTTRKILEVCHTPLAASCVNEVLLDKVRCTEVDVNVNGIINEFIDIGDVILTFDRPTHQEEFMLENIKNPRNVGLFLSDVLDQGQRTLTPPVWFKQKDKFEGGGNGHRFRFIDDITPKYQAGGLL